MEGNLIKITLRQNSGTQFDVTVSSKGTVRDLKDACVEKASLSADEQRLIFKGKILKDEMTLEEYKIEDGVVVHLVKGKSAASSGGAPTTSATTTNTNPTTTNANP